MNKNIAMKWVKALRSGDYIQGNGQLKTEDGKFCCLGVLCEVTKKQSGFINYTKMNDNYKQHNGGLPVKIRKYLEMESHNGTLSRFKMCLTEMNDAGRSFNKISDIIENYWEKL